MMKACVIQPAYSLDYAKIDEYYAAQMELLSQCDDSMDMIVMPEYSNVPCCARTKEEMLAAYEKFSGDLLEKAAATAKCCHALLFVNCIYPTETGLRNTTVIFDREGKQAGCYFKQHCVESEMYVYELDKDYGWEHSEPTIIELEGVKYGFLVCYDAYFYEAYANIARYNPDVIVACSYQRSDTHDALETMHKFCAYNCNAHVVRASVSLGDDSPVGGCSMVIAPDGKVLLNMHNEVGLGCAEFDPHNHYLKAAGFGNPPATHHAYIEIGRRPWKYRPAGSAICRHDEIMAYPRMCAHRGFNTIAPENSMPAYGAAIGLGADEIEFDLWPSKDNVVVSIHDPVLDRVSDGHGNVWEHTYEELLQYDFGACVDSAYAGLRIPTFEDILKKFACHTVMNVHIKSWSDWEPMPIEFLEEIIRLIDKYDCRKYCYFMTGNEIMLNDLRRLAPDICRCAGADSKPESDLVEKALRTGSKKIQLFCPWFEKNGGDAYVKAMIDKAHANGLVVNVFYADTVEDATNYLDMGADTILTNDYQRVAQTAKGREKYLKR